MTWIGVDVMWIGVIDWNWNVTLTWSEIVEDYLVEVERGLVAVELVRY